jgi:hypothetical protein
MFFRRGENFGVARARYGIALLPPLDRADGNAELSGHGPDASKKLDDVVRGVGFPVRVFFVGHSPRVPVTLATASTPVTPSAGVSGVDLKTF